MTPPCDLCPRNSGQDCRPVLSTGPEPSVVLLVGAGPGKVEAQTLTPYTGLAGDELTQTYLAVAQIRREDVAICNSTLCWDGTDRTPSDKRVMACASRHLPEVLSRVRPEVVVLMGGAVQGLSDTRVRLDMQHGIPFWGSVLGGTWTGWIWPSYEPALGMRETSRMTQLINDFRHLGQWLKGEWVPASAANDQTYLKVKDYQIAHSRSCVQDYFDAYDDSRSRQIAVDTETHGGRPWSVQFSVKPHTGRLILAEDRTALNELSMWMHGREIILHNAGQDLDTLDRMGLPVMSYRDTMQESYHLCSLPQGLKPLAYRLLGVTMRSWEDVVRPASVTALMEWVGRAVEVAVTEFQAVEVTQYKRAKCLDCGHTHTKGKCMRTVERPTDKAGIKTVKGEVVYTCGCDSFRPGSTSHTSLHPGALESILRHVTRYVESTADADDPYDGWEALRRMRTDGLRGKVAEEWEWEYVEDQVGPIPILGIGNVELEAAVAYGCSDSDHTLQVARKLAELRGGEEWRVDEGDRDR